MKIYLASSSPRRKRLLKWFGLDFKVVSHGFDESLVKTKEAEALVGELALRKAASALRKIKTDDGLVIGSDLVVSLGKKIMGKPKDLKEAREMLRKLRAKEHKICCGIAVVEGKTGKAVMSVAVTKVKMKDYGDEVIREYVKKFEVLDKGGSYAVQDEIKGFGSLVERFEGGITTIIGLPLDYLENLLKEFGVKPRKDWRKICKQETGYEY